ncbi:MAG TPA: ABC transporter ATP-binding protein [Myxococcales bacterium]|nr:ABC transporter ATP-binding protein [Myxococcales bacterium]
MLEVSHVSAGYGDLTVVNDVSFHVEEGEVVSLVGSNGAGKSTILRTVAGLLRPKGGEIRLRKERIDRTAPYDIVRRRVAMVPEGRQLFGRLPVIDNLLLGAYTLPQAEVQGALADVLRLFPILAERRGQRAETLSGGEQQQLAIARGLMSRPSLLMLDEPSLGIMPRLVAQIFDTIHRIREQGVTVLLVEQNVFEALEISDRGYVLQSGRIVLEGAGKDLLGSDLVRKAYLGIAA